MWSINQWVVILGFKPPNCKGKSNSFVKYILLGGSHSINSCDYSIALIVYKTLWNDLINRDKEVERNCTFENWIPNVSLFQGKKKRFKDTW